MRDDGINLAMSQRRFFKSSLHAQSYLIEPAGGLDEVVVEVVHFLDEEVLGELNVALGLVVLPVDVFHGLVVPLVQVRLKLVSLHLVFHRVFHQLFHSF